VVSVRLSGEEKAAIDAAARQQGVLRSDFLRRAALVVAHRLVEAAKPKPKPAELKREPRREPGPHFTTTYPSFEAYRNRGGFTPGPDTAAIAARYRERLET
jgi:hypothetical protein